eukprot:3618075-Amphidinium_carterae.1
MDEGGRMPELPPKQEAFQKLFHEPGAEDIKSADDAKPEDDEDVKSDEEVKKEEDDKTEDVKTEQEVKTEQCADEASSRGRGRQSALDCDGQSEDNFATIDGEPCSQD